LVIYWCAEILTLLLKKRNELSNCWILSEAFCEIVSKIILARQIINQLAF
jgi:hypothetical protein